MKTIDTSDYANITAEEHPPRSRTPRGGSSVRETSAWNLGVGALARVYE